MIPKTKNTTQAEHHMHVRKRIHLRELKDYGIIDHLVYIAGPLIPIAIIPQALTVWVQKETAGTSIITWIILCFTSFVMACYALKHKEKPLILTYVPLFVLNVMVVIGLILYS